MNRDIRNVPRIPAKRYKVEGKNRYIYIYTIHGIDNVAFRFQKSVKKLK